MYSKVSIAKLVCIEVWECLVVDVGMVGGRQTLEHLGCQADRSTPSGRSGPGWENSRLCNNRL